MSPRRQVRAVANPKVKGVTSKCPVAENNSSVSRTRSGRQVDKSIPELPRKLTKSAPPSPSKHHPPRPISSPSSRSLPKPETPKRTLQRSTRNSPVPNSASAKKTPSKLSSKISSSDTILKKKSHQTTTSLGINVKTTPKKVPLKTAVPEKKLKTTPKKAPPKSTTLPENNVKTTLKKTPLKVNTSSANKTTPKKVLPKTITSSEKNVKITPKKVPLKNTSAENNVQTTPKKGSSKTPVSNNGLRSPTRQMSTRGSPQSKVLLLTFSPKKVVGHASPAKSPNRSLKSASKPTVSSPVSPNRLTRKRLLSSPSKSPVAAKRRLRGDNVLIPLQMKSELVSDDDCVVLDGVLKDGPQSTLERGEINPSALFHASKQNKITSLKKTGAALPSDPELSGRFLRRKWFSLKTRGGFTCLRSAILSPEEIAKEVIQHTMIDTPQVHDANFFTTKLMVRLSSRLPPTRARPSCEELVDLINSKQTGKNADELKEPKREGTAIRVKVERRSFSDTISHVTSNPSKGIGGPATQIGSQSRIGGVFLQSHGNLSKKQEREIALQQLKILRYW